MQSDRAEHGLRPLSPASGGEAGTAISGVNKQRLVMASQFQRIARCGPMVAPATSILSKVVTGFELCNVLPPIEFQQWAACSDQNREAL
ncbi:hypothetical protein [Novipirellula artificiosorum]|uniref:hypothetical protein n=1 Tax=Novipirellula artificiosorum TaxID=2528016 RepID=UPI0018CFAB1C|nr:hypothetical protein [Novipirellula artificiosorum]